ncbi:MAG: hypothetical protein ACKVZ6_09275 [Kineosporiaceae bacterium]
MTRRLPPVVPATTLRVYEPLEAFAIAERPALEALALRQGADRRADEAERAASWRAVLTGQGAVVPGVDGGPPEVAAEPRPARTRPPGGRRHLAVRVLRSGGVVLVCPVGEQEDEDGRRAQRPPRRLVRIWTLPEAWFALVRTADGERAGGRGRYLVPMSTARSRAARALKTLRLGVGETELTAETELLARWLESFHPRAWVEVDASAIIGFTGGEDGAEDVRLGLECLAAGDATGAAASYHRLTNRQRLLDSLSRSS